MEKIVISLERTPERKKKFIKNNDKYLVNYSFMNAIDGNKLNINNLTSEIIRPGSQFSRGAIGCALSHYKIWNKIVETNKPIITIEDDAIFNKDFEKILVKILKNLPTDWDIVLFSHNYDSCIDFYIQENERIIGSHANNKPTIKTLNKFQNKKIKNAVTFPLVNCFGTSCLMTSPAGARKILKSCFPMDNRIIQVSGLHQLKNIKCFSIDCLLNSIYKNINSFIVLPDIVTAPNDILQSTIKNEEKRSLV